MSLEKDIHQLVPFTSEHHKAVVNLIYTYNWTVERLKRSLDEVDITLQQFNILRILRGSKEPLSTLQIRERMLDKMSDTSRLVDRLIRKGLARKKTAASDKRLVDVTITAKGLQLLAKLDKRSKEMDDILSALTISECKTLNKLLDKLRG
ncbi:MarR family winged helix-turn-helix transcriptional regulator [Dinghuibacter silviterrae]|uniref:DNA-binding MarR family transcriptional regulator n=1 Tax=Dinghuibacter silviterrae TaxID=1539049 RepID=A0A4R8DNZ5_9BACT|nr:MarR family transcriptional regulator [Dinghuibacter silviterrae]TDW99773.1 DNA-binding MarR family transcriptional regulator [Dinghuibacter silviterrae]